MTRRIAALSALLLVLSLLVPARWSAAGGCTLYTSPAGSDANPGTLTSPTSLQQSERDSVPGSVICIEPGTYTMVYNGDAGLKIIPARSGSPGLPVTYELQPGATGPAILDYGVAQPFGPEIKLDSGTSWITITGLTFDGHNTSSYAIFSNGAPGSPGTPNSHVTFSNNTIMNQGRGGIQTTNTDWVTVDHNTIWHTGYSATPACTDGSCSGSGISLNQSPFSDPTPGFHSFVTNNIIGGTIDESGANTDGNGIILDLSDVGTENTAPALIANNVVYENGGRCLEALHSSNDWFVNNSCYKNLLDLRSPSIPAPCEVSLYGVLNPVVVNNAVYAWAGGGTPYCVFDATGTAVTSFATLNVTFSHNSWFSGRTANVVPAADQANPAELRIADPTYAHPPTVDASAGGQYADAPDPVTVGSFFQLQGTSPLIGAGIDPRTLTTDGNLQAGMNQYILSGLNGTARPQGGSWDIGAYAYRAPVTPPSITPPSVTPFSNYRPRTSYR